MTEILNFPAFMTSSWRQRHLASLNTEEGSRKHGLPKISVYGKYALDIPEEIYALTDFLEFEF